MNTGIIFEEAIQCLIIATLYLEGRRVSQVTFLMLDSWYVMKSVFSSGNIYLGNKRFVMKPIIMPTAQAVFIIL
jgi:hypothetical protein